MMEFGLFAAALAIVCLILCLLAERPKKGTLEWIDVYDRPNWHIPAPSPQIDGFDWLWSLIPAVACGGLWLAVSLLTEMPLLTTVWPAFLIGILCYLLSRLLGGSVLTGLCASILLLALSSLPLLMLPAGGVLVLLWLWIRRGYGVWSWAYLTCCALLLAAAQLVVLESVLLLIPVLAVIVVVMIRRIREGECSFWRLIPTVLIVPAAFLLAEGVGDAVTLGAGFPEFLSDARFWEFLLRHLTPEFLVGAWHLEQLLWFDLPSAMVLLAGIPVLLAGTIRRRERTARYLLFWDLSAAALWCVTTVDLLPIMAVPTCAWLAQRMLIRKHRALAVLILTVPAALTLALTAYHLFDIIGGY